MHNVNAHLQEMDSLKCLYENMSQKVYFLEQYQEATNHNSIVSKTDSKGIITFANEEFCKISEYSQEELIGKSHNIVRHPNNPKELYEKIWHCLKKEKKVWKGLIRNISKSGKSYYVKTTIQPILDAQNNIVEYIALRDDVTDVMNPKKQLEDLVNSFHDTIVVMMKIENYDDLEKLYGSDMLAVIEEKFTKILMTNRPVDCEFEKFYSLGSGIYVFAKSKSLCTLGLKKMIKKLKLFQENINDTTIDIGDVEYDIAMIVSLAYGNNALENVKFGIKKLEETKREFIVANKLAQTEEKSAKKNIKVLKEIKKSLNEYKMLSYFQVVVNNKTMKVEKYESLVRLMDENNQIIEPSFFLDVAKKGKYYSKITARVLENSFDALKKTDKSISINISVLDIERRNTRMKIFEFLNIHKEDASRVIFELLEDEDTKDFKKIVKFIKEVKKFGVKIAIDDFGAGYSNFERLLDYQPDLLKIDGSLIRNIETNSYSKSVVKTIVAFAKEQNIETIAEYVENENIYKILKKMGVDYSQGYYFGKPEPLSKLIAT